MVERCLHGGGGLGRPRRALTALALSALASGCYSYTEVSPAAVPPGSYVRLTLEPTARVDAAGEALLEGTRSVRGRLVEGSSAETLRFSVALGGGDPRVASRGLRSSVAVPTADVSRLEVRQLEKGRTGALIGASGFVAYLVTKWAFNVLDPSSDPSDGGGGTDNARFVLFRLGW
ncbi:MAG: hypothetical protein Q8N53_01705 [Longimicrobiales bacterium]|nr:hypothetical protein [Longimicrobiales bacterium]